MDEFTLKPLVLYKFINFSSKYKQKTIVMTKMFVHTYVITNDIL